MENILPISNLPTFLWNTTASCMLLQLFTTKWQYFVLNGLEKIAFYNVPVSAANFKTFHNKHYQSCTASLTLKQPVLSNQSWERSKYELEYMEQVENTVFWCKKKNIQLNTRKTEQKDHFWMQGYICSCVITGSSTSQNMHLCTVL